MTTIHELLTRGPNNWEQNPCLVAETAAQLWPSLEASQRRRQWLEVVEAWEQLDACETDPYVNSDPEAQARRDWAALDLQDALAAA